MTSSLDHAWQKEQSRLRPTLLTVDAVSWSDGPDPDLFWVPEDLTPLWGTQGYEALSEQQRLVYNHFYAQWLAEQFRWIEISLICAPLTRLQQTRDLNTAAAAVLASFYDDELRHVECFDQLAKLATRANNWPRGFFNPPALIRFLAFAAARAPVLLPFWIGVVETFETYAVAIGQAYDKANNVDPLFTSVFLTHARDEARHCQYDALLSSWLVQKQSMKMKKLNGWLLNRFSERYYSVDWGWDGPINAMGALMPEITSQQRERLIRGLKDSPLNHPRTVPSSV